MKKSLVIISFAFIFLLTMSVVSAGFWDWLTGKGTTVEIKGGCDATGGPACPKKTIAAAYECPPLPEGICKGEADPKSITIEGLREMVKEAGGEYKCPPLPEGICDGEADPKSPAFKESDKIVTKKRTSAGVSSSGTRCFYGGIPPKCDNTGTITRADGRQVRPMLGVNNNRRPTATLPPSSMLNCPPDWDAKSARDGGSYCVQKNQGLGGGDTPRACTTTCGESTCSSYGPHSNGWCCICTGYSQTCTSTCSGGGEEGEVVVEVN